MNISLIRRRQSFAKFACFVIHEHYEHTFRSPGRRRAYSSTHEHSTLSTPTNASNAPRTVVAPRADVSNKSLKWFVANGQLGAANRVRLKLLREGTPIHESSIYEKAALNCLKEDDVDACVRCFSEWFTHVPDIDDVSPPGAAGHFSDIRSELFNSGQPALRLPVITCFAVIAASKGYIGPIFDEAIEITARYATPGMGARFLQDVEEAATNYAKDRHPEQEQSISSRFRSVAVEVSCQAGWLDEALRFARQPRDFSIPNKTYDLLLYPLLAKHLHHEIRSVEGLRLLDMSRKAEDARLGWASPTSTDSFSPLAPSTSLPDGFSADNKILEMVSNVRHAIEFDKLRKSDVYEAFSTIQNSSILESLRQHALAQNKNTRDIWMVTELKFYYRHKQYRKLLAVFIAYCDVLHSLPRAFIDALPMVFSMENLPDKVDFYATSSYKLGHHHRWLVLRAIINLAKDSSSSPIESVQTLYTSFLEGLTHSKGRAKGFLIFIRAFGECGDAERAAQVLQDIMNLGISPDIRHYENLAVTYARLGYEDRAFETLERIENGAVVGLKPQVAQIHLSTFGLMIDGFLKSGMIESAIKVEQLLRKRQYIPGLAELDATLAALERIKRGIGN